MDGGGWETTYKRPSIIRNILTLHPQHHPRIGVINNTLMN